MWCSVDGSKQAWHGAASTQECEREFTVSTSFHCVVEPVPSRPERTCGAGCDRKLERASALLCSGCLLFRV